MAVVWALPCFLQASVQLHKTGWFSGSRFINIQHHGAFFWVKNTQIHGLLVDVIPSKRLWRCGFLVYYGLWISRVTTRSKSREIQTQWKNHSLPREIVMFCEKRLHFMTWSPHIKYAAQTNNLLLLSTHWTTANLILKYEFTSSYVVPNIHRKKKQKQ